jgi:hypothetical protein
VRALARIVLVPGPIARLLREAREHERAAEQPGLHEALREAHLTVADGKRRAARRLIAEATGR